MSAPGRSEALIPERASAEGFSTNAPGRSEALFPERAARGVSP
jgi:hypothetical protein